MDTSAARLTVYNLAERVGTASIFTWIHAAMLMTDGVHRTVLGAGAVSFRLAASHIRIAHVIRRTLTHRIVRRPGNAKCRRMAGIRTARLHSNTLDVGYGIRAKARWTLANRFVIVRDADRVHTASILVAGVVTGVGQSIAKLRQRAVDVVDAGDRAASGRGVIWIAGV